MEELKGKSRVLIDEFEVSEQIVRHITTALMKEGYDIDAEVTRHEYREATFMLKVYDTNQMILT